MQPEEEAKICAWAAEAIYGTNTDSSGKSTSEATMKALDFTEVLWIDLPDIPLDVCAFLATSEKCNVLAFRGTKTPQDWMTDAECAPIEFDRAFANNPPIGQIHSGFARCLAFGLSRISLPLLRLENPTPFFITGHSLGGAMAALSAVLFATSNLAVPPVSRIYTFGQPRIGFQLFCDEYSKRLGGKLVRFVNKMDIVPRVPLRVMSYADYGTLIHFDSSDKPTLEAPEWHSGLETAYQSLTDVLEMSANMRVDIGYHSVMEYRRLVVNNEEHLAPLLTPT